MTTLLVNYNFRTLPAHWSSHHTTYWQHGDHLGSASWVTDTNGTACQHLQYMPWGEPLVDLRSSSSSYDTRYTFSGKERDEETGFSYFGSRYYNSSLSIWLSVDPMAAKYPSLSPYAYCANNPVKLVDPNGEELVNPYEAMCNDTKRVINRIQALLKSGDLTKEQRSEARSALRTQKAELRTLNRKCARVNSAISELLPDLKDKLDNLHDELANSVDVYVYMVEDLPDNRTGQCIEDDISSKDHFYGFNHNRVTIELTGKEIGETINHEGGHLEYDVPNFSKKIAWQKQYGFYYNGYNGHGEKDGEEDPSGKNANARENEYKNRRYSY